MEITGHSGRFIISVCGQNETINFICGHNGTVDITGRILPSQLGIHVSIITGFGCILLLSTHIVSSKKFLYDLCVYNRILLKETAPP